MRLIDTDALKFPNIAIFDMKLHGITVPMVRLIDLQMLMPTVDAVPVKHGRWINMKNGNADCSVCGRHVVSVYDDDNADRFCRCCGAKVDLT
jgi:hypothetical protein